MRDRTRLFWNLVAVNLDGTASSDPDPGDTLSYSWIQTAGPNVALTGGNTAQPSFTSPDVTAGNPVTLTFELTVNDGTDDVTDTVDVVVSEPRRSHCGRQDSSMSLCRPTQIAAASISARPRCDRRVASRYSSSTATMTTTSWTQHTTDANGDYSFSNVAANTDVRIRVRAELKQAGAPGWDVEVRDNVDTSANPPPLAQRPLYVVQWASFNTGGIDIADANFTAETGWDGASYTGTRAAAPLAILDQVYTGMRSILAERPSRGRSRRSTCSGASTTR